jgi:hypothetical protein
MDRLCSKLMFLTFTGSDKHVSLLRNLYITNVISFTIRAPGERQMAEKEVYDGEKVFRFVCKEEKTLN